eukprot:Lankesteria_metandrocarpae@DN331_c0_g1_i1.p1
MSSVTLSVDAGVRAEETTRLLLDDNTSYTLRKQQRRGASYYTQKKILFTVFGAACTVSQVALFLTMEDLQKVFFPGMYYAVSAQIAFALGFGVASALCICLGVAKFNSPIRAASLLLLGIASTVCIILFSLLGANTQLGYIGVLVAVGILTAASVTLIPISFFFSMAMPSGCSQAAARGQSLPLIFGSTVLYILSIFLGPLEFVITSFSVCACTQFASMIAILLLKRVVWAEDGLKLLKGKREVTVLRGVDGGDAELAVKEERHSEKRIRWNLIRVMSPRLFSVFFAPFVAFAVFPSVTVALAAVHGRRFAIFLTAVFCIADLVGRRFSEYTSERLVVYITAPVVCVFAVLQAAYLPMFALMCRGGAYSLPLPKLIATATMAFNNGWIINQAYTLPQTFFEFHADSETVSFYMSVANALGIPCGTALCLVLMVSGVWVHLDTITA